MTGLFDDVLFNMNLHHRNAGYPPANAYQETDESLIIELAVAGFKQDELDVAFENSVLVVSGKRNEKEDRAYLLKGIASRDFTRSFNIRGSYEIDTAHLENGLLTIRLVNVSQRKKIPILLK
jgi:molecular chaperone IbpA